MNPKDLHIVIQLTDEEADYLLSILERDRVSLPHSEDWEPIYLSIRKQITQQMEF